MNIEGAIFDLDGTLLDSMGAWDTVACDYLISCGATPKPDLKDKIKIMTIRQAGEYFKSEYGIDSTPEKMREGIGRIMGKFYSETVEAKPRVGEFLSLLKSKGVKMCICSATESELIKIALKRCGLLEFFSGVFSCADVGKGKDFPDVYNLGLSHLGTEISRTYVFEDALYAMQTAKTAGFQTVGVYDSSEPYQQELKDISDYYIKDYGSAIELFK
ncbi:MAG: HAD family phosphatase [Clostridia bacterium]|nr:HAD family phosphatase [Clostridia bacterium]